MRKGIMIGSDRKSRTIEEIIKMVQAAEDAGLESAWMANIFSFDAIMTMTLAASATKSIKVGTAVTPTYPRHPAAIAQQAVTAAAASNNRFILGIGLSHRRNIEGVYGMSYNKPARHMREYLNIVMPLVNQQSVNFEGEQYTTRGMKLDAPGSKPVPVILAALAPVMLKLAGSVADGTNTWMVGPRTMEDHIVPSINRAAADAGRSNPMVVGNFPVVLTNNVDAARHKLGEFLAVYNELPSYRSMLDKEGYDSPVDAALVGDETTLRQGIARIKDSGVTDFGAAVYDFEDGAFQRTLDFLASV